MDTQDAALIGSELLAGAEWLIENNCNEWWCHACLPSTAAFDVADRAAPDEEDTISPDGASFFLLLVMESLL